MRKPYKAFPVDKADPTITNEVKTYWPVLQVRVQYAHAASPRFDAIVDSGSPWCLFKADVGRLIGISDVTKGKPYSLGGVIGNVTEPMWFHRVKIYVEAEGIIEVNAGFAPKLSVTGILGRNGFFNNFQVSFDHSTTPPELEIHRIHRA